MCDENQNFLVLKLSIDGKIGIFASVYGPNGTDRRFFGDLERAINRLKGGDDVPVVMGGDWNTTWDNRPIQVNIDTFQMAGLPNPVNSDMLKNLCNTLHLTDPYRLLYPNKRDFSYQPFGTVRLNRSRIDFFCISNSITGSVDDCKISSSPLCSLFDHKNITLRFGTVAPPEKNAKLTNCFLDSKILKYAVKISAHRCHVFAINRGNPELTNLVQEETGRVGRIWSSIKNYLALELRNAKGEGIFNENMAAGELTNIELLLMDLRPISDLDELEKTCTRTEFFTALVDEVKKTSIWTQKKLFHITKEKVRTLESKINMLKMNFDHNFDEIFNLERKVGKIKDEELRVKLRDLKIFECLNAEKASPHFLNIAKKSNKESSISNISKDDGTAFIDENSREKHIVDFYANLYKHDLNVNGEINDFLGPEIANQPQIRASKLTPAEKAALDAPLTIEELDKSLKKVNIKSAPGIDGYSYRFIKQFWEIFRIPLFECASEALETGNMPDSFLCAQIKIIPKKGDTSKIKNWRPISLLSNFYKIISRLINNRLKKITNRVMSRGQKGFNQSRQIHEVLINALENMNFCKKNNIKGAMLSIDMAKAFDSVSHSYLEKVYEFFGFGDRIRKWLRAIGTGRNAVIILENGRMSSKFELKRGTAQGDSPSPFLYNLAAQILIWKIELDPEIKGIYPDRNRNQQIGEIDHSFFAYEGNGETNKNESFADDANNFILLEYSTIARLKTVLENFRALSGLECNVDKSYIMRIGNLDGELDPNILNLGFPVTNEITVLGFTLQNNGNMIAKNYEKVREKIHNIIRFWERFNLTLPGKITIYKTLLLPQINYIATILTPTTEIFNELEESMIKFVTKGLNIGKGRLYTDPREGGIGLFNLEQFVTALQCGWIRRAQVKNDNWKLALLGDTGNALDCHLLDPEQFGTGLKNIIKSYTEFRRSFYDFKNNFMLDKIFRNQRYGTGRGMQNKFDDEFFGQELLNQHIQPLTALTWHQLSVNNEFVRWMDFELFAGFNIDLRRYNLLKNCFNNLRKKFGGESEEPVDIGTFYRKIKKGSKAFRKILAYRCPKKSSYENNPMVKSFCKITNVPKGGRECWERALGAWNTFCFPNRFKTFLFKYYSNILGTGNRVAHFNREVDPSCNFCVKKQPLPAPLETFTHIFYECPEVEKVFTRFSDKYFVEQISRDNYFNGDFEGTKRDLAAINLLLDAFRYTVWQCKLQKNNLSFYTIENETINLLETITQCSNKIKYSINQCNLINVDGDRQRQHGRPHP
jgi:hypothetical protein